MMLVELTSTPTEDLPIEAFKAHLRLGTGFSDDGLQNEVLESFLRAAIGAIEARIGKMMLSRRVSWTITRWAHSGSQPLPVAPVTAIQSISLMDRAGTETTVDAGSYDLERDTHRPRVFAYSSTLPVISNGGSATIIFDAGYGADWSAVPSELRQAVLMLAAHYYENRRDTSGAGGLMPFGVMSLLDPHRNIRIFEARS
ncbi:head-tail connector protein [Litoreibacter roseus]|uniref:PhiE125 gp8 family phage protein n=1 Tax=Litoreibacter roseus TaxID=2601869 RepID=A0A6N6JMN9_9RHOB|nr:head-tail connector protein [Litoreibacter roseus]GFE66709.1 hypothetical protein KIN_37830 [Litoreibacter roseus]